MGIKNQKGSTFIENIISVFLLALFSLLVFSSLLTAINTLGDSWELDANIREGYNGIEESYGSDALGTGIILEDGATLTFRLSGDSTVYTIEGSYMYDDEQLVGEFVKDEAEKESE